MKKTMTYVVAAAAVAMALVSCSKDKLIEKGTRNEQTSGMRTLTVSFAQGTKTSISNDMKTPVWAEGDKISLNGTPYEVPADAKGKPTCTITTDIQGDIVAVYPASAWTAEEPHYKVESTQDGSFSKANICIDTVKVGDTKIEFKNKTALFYVKIKAGDKNSTLKVTSLKAIGEDGQRSGSEAAITNDGVNANEITVAITASSYDQDCYVSVLPGVKLTDLNFDITRDGETGKGEQGGFSANYLKDTKEIAEPYLYAVVENTIYTVDPSFLHEYVEVKMTVQGGSEKTYKWATMNIGATSATDAGDYFAWGATEVAYESLTNHDFTFKTGKPASYVYSNGYTGPWAPEEGFADCNTPYYDGESFSDSKYNIVEGKKVLDLSDDAANANWGGSWRMPTNEEFTAFLGDTETYEAGDNGSFTHQGVTFPAAGCGHQTDIGDLGCGDYWSSSLYTVSKSRACCFTFYDDTVCPDYEYRHAGYSVRALSD